MTNRRIDKKLKSRILRFYKITGGNSSETSRRLKRAGYSTTQTTVCTVWRSEGYEPEKKGTGNPDGLKNATSERKGIELIVKLYEQLNREPHRVKPALEKEGYHASYSEIIRYWTMVRAYDRYDRNPGKAAKALGCNGETVKKCWGLLCLPMNIKIQPQGNLEEKL